MDLSVPRLVRAGAVVVALFFALVTSAAAEAIPAFGVNDLRSDGLVLPVLGWDGITDLDILAAGGISLYRARVRMDCVARGNGSYDFASSSCFGISYDDLVGELAKRGQTLLPVLLNFGPTGHPSPPQGPDGRAAFASFAAAAAARYGPNGRFWSDHPELTPRPVRAWEVWNEENNGFYWNGAVSPTEYADLFTAVKAAIRAVDPEARLVVGGLTWDPGGQSSYREPEDVVTTLLAQNANAFDAVAIHPYTDARGRSADGMATDALTLTDRMADALRSAAGTDTFGAPRQQIWVTELGWSSLDASDSVIADALRAYVNALDTGRRAADNVGPFLWYAFRDNTTKSSRDDQLGLRRTAINGSDAGAKPVWDAFLEMAARRATVDLPPALADSGPYTPSSGTQPTASPAERRCAGVSTKPRSSKTRATARKAALCLVAALRDERGLAAPTVSSSIVRRSRGIARNKVLGVPGPKRGSATFWTLRRTRDRATASSIVASWMNKATIRRRLLSPVLRIGLASEPIGDPAGTGGVLYVLGVRAG